MTEEFRKLAPAPLAPKSFNIPQPFETELANGLKVIIFEEKRLPLVSFRLKFRSGDIDDPQGEDGLISAMASLLMQGTETRSSREIAEEIDRLGASLNTSASADNTTVSASALSIYKTEILKLLADVTLHPSFPENELKLYKENTVKELHYQRSQADFLAEEQTARIIFGSHPYSSISPKPEDIKKISREKLIEIHRQTLIPNNAMLVVVGDVEREKLLGELSELFADWKQGELSRTTFDEPPVRTERTLTIVDRAGSAQSNIVLANLGIKRKNPDYFPLLVMNQILGAGASSRVFMNLREEKGYTYGAYTSFDFRRQTGSFEATAEVRSAVTGDSLKEFFSELERIRSEKVADEELQDAQNFLTGVFPIRAETQEGLTNLIVGQKIYDLPDNYLQTYRENVSRVTAEDVQRVAREYIHPDALAIVIVGDAGEVLPQAKSYAEKIEIFDTNGDPQDAAKYEDAANEPPADINGKWDLTIEIQGQNLPVSLNLSQKDASLEGNFESPFGTGTITEGKVSGSKVRATVSVDFQGQEIDVLLIGNVENENSMKGVLSAQMEGMPDLPFAGSRS